MHHSRFSVLILVTLICTFPIGCGPRWNRAVGQLGAEPDTYDLAGEQVSVSLLTLEELTKEAKRLKVSDSESIPQKAAIRKESVGGLIAAAAIPALVDFGFKLLKQEIEKEAARYEQSFSSKDFGAGFWTIEKAGDDALQKWYGLHVVRKTDASEKAFELLAVLDTEDTGDFVIVKPLYICTNTTRAKLFSGNRIADTSIQCVLRSQWIDATGKLQNRDIGVVDWDIDLLLGKKHKFNLKEGGQGKKEIGALPVPPTSFGWNKGRDDKGKQIPVWKPNPAGGLMDITVTVTEKDSTVAVEVVKKVGEIVDDVREPILKDIKARLDVSESGSNATEADTKPKP